MLFLVENTLLFVCRNQNNDVYLLHKIKTKKMEAANLYVGQRFLNENTAFNYEESEKNTIIEIKGKSIVLSCTSCFGTFIVTKRIDKVIKLVNNNDWKII